MGRLLPLVIEEHDAERNASEDISIGADIDAELPLVFKRKTLEIEHDIASEEIAIRRHLDIDLSLKRIDELLTIGINEGYSEFVLAFVFCTEADPESKSTLGMHDWSLPRADGVEGTEKAELTIIIGGGVAE